MEIDIQELHDILDKVNGKYGNEQELCLFCHSNQVDASGIIHNPTCIIQRIRHGII